jgi:hypothetical protein
MDGATAIYLGKIVDKKHFRVFVYSADGQKRLVESWKEFESLMETGLWFASEYVEKKEDKKLDKDFVIPTANKVQKSAPKKSHKDLAFEV